MKKRNNRVSNNVLVGLIVAAMVFSVISTFASLNYLNSYTGAASTGTVTVTPASTASCTTDSGDGDNTVAFGTQARGISNTSTQISDWFIVENDGNSNITVQIYATEDLWDNYAAPTTNWRANCNSTQSGASCSQTYQIINATQGTAETIVTDLDPTDSLDYVVAGINITVPNDEPAGAKSGSVTFYCTET